MIAADFLAPNKQQAISNEHADMTKLRLARYTNHVTTIYTYMYKFISYEIYTSIPDWLR